MNVKVNQMKMFQIQHGVLFSGLIYSFLFSLSLFDLMSWLCSSDSEENSPETTPQHKSPARVFLLTGSVFFVCFCFMCLFKCTFFVCQVTKMMKSALKWMMNYTKLWWFILCVSPVYCILETFLMLKCDVSSYISSKLPILCSFLQRKPQKVH